MAHRVGEIAFRGTRRKGSVRAALLALNGAGRDELLRASARTSRCADSCVLVAVDGGWDACRAAGMRPDLFVGDADSVKRLPKGAPAVLFATDKAFSDLAGALREASRLDVDVVAVAGLLGGRLDHEWANVAELGRNGKKFAGFVAPTRRGTVVVTSRGCRVETVRGRTVSLFPVGGSVTVTLRGTRWTLREKRLPSGSVGLSNVAGTRLDLIVHRGCAALVFPE